MKKSLQDELLELIQDSISEFNTDKITPTIDFPADSRFGDLSTNIALQLSKKIKKNPIELASGINVVLKSSLKNSPVKDFVREIKVEGAGFINFYLSENYFYAQLREIILSKGDVLRFDAGRGKKVLIEFVSANPTGSLSVAHARQAAVGDALANLLDYLGFSVKREYYLNDEGNQINILGESVRLRLKELSGEKIEFPENYYQGDYIYDIARKADELISSSAHNLGDFAANYILDIIKKELDDFGVHFDYWYSQKSLRESGKIQKAFDILKQNGFLYEQDGALWFKSTQFGDDKDRVVIKSDGSYTYLAPDIAYHQEKFRRGFQWLINLWGPDHHGYINRLRAAVEAFGKSKDSLSIIIVQLATIFREGKPVQMSTRRGEYITLREVLDEVGKDAARFFFLMRRTSSHLDFDLEVAKKHTSENPVYYVQYAHARICSILRSTTLQSSIDQAPLNLLKEKEELGLIKKICQMPQNLNTCLATQDPYMLTVYLQELAESFHKFYDLHRVLGGEQGLTQARLALIEGTKIVIALGLKLIGVSQPQEM